jgi:RNase adapter protein RapZ
MVVPETEAEKKVSTAREAGAGADTGAEAMSGVETHVVTGAETSAATGSGPAAETGGGTAAEPASEPGAAPGRRPDPAPDGAPDSARDGVSDEVPDSGADGAGPRLVLITGPSGGGRSTAINVLEDLGFEVIDNMPLSLLPRLLEGPALSRSLALGIDVRNRDFSVEATLALMDSLSRSSSGLVVDVLYLDARADVLVRRFSETRRRHPLAPAESVQTGIARELDLLASIRARADFLIDTSELTPHDLRRELDQWFSEGGKAELAVSVQSFSYKRGVPHGIDMVFDCRFLRNPYWDESLRDLTGQDARVHEFVSQDQRFAPFFDQVLALSEMLLPAYMEEGKSHFSIGFGCTGGQHRSVTTAEKMSAALAMGGWQVSIRHRELERRGLLVAPGKLR